MKAVWKQRWINGGLALGSIFLTCAVLECGMRWMIPRKAPTWEEEIVSTQQAIKRSFDQDPVFKTHPYVLFQPNTTVMHEDGVEIRGQRFTFEKPSNVLRIACLGGSTTMGGYPKTLQFALEHLIPNRKIEVMDWGCSNWTILESTLNYLVRGQLFQPDFVIVHHGVNDIAPRMRKDFLVDYSHYRKSFEFDGFSWWQTTMNWSWLATFVRLRLGIAASHLDMLSVIDKEPETTPPARRTAATFKESLFVLHHLAESRGAQLILAGMMHKKNADYDPVLKQVLLEHNRELASFATHHHYSYIDVHRHFEEHESFFTDEFHLREIGNQKKGFVISSAVARLLNAPSSLWISDSIECAQPLQGGLDQDPADNRGLGIHWDSFYSTTDLTDIFVRVDGGPEQFLARINQSQSQSLAWKPGNPLVDPAFRSGPEFGKTYDFVAYQIDSANEKIEAMLGIPDPIHFQEIQP
jgi:hypothetical protein